MRSSWSALHDHLVRAVARHAAHAAFTDIKAREAALARFSDPVALIDFLHRTDGDRDAKNAALSALVIEAQADASATAARDILHLSLWPGLDAVYRRRLRHFRGEPDVLAALATELFLVGVARLDLTRVNRIAATLVRNVERDVVRHLQRRWRREALARPLEEAPPVLRCGVAELLGSLSARDADLVHGVAVGNETQCDAAARLGISHEAARKRHQRAMTTLRATLAA